MTHRTGTHSFSQVRALALAMAATAALAAAGCASSSDDATLFAVDPALATRSGGPIDTGTYPNLNIAPKAATSQFTPDESQAKLAALQAAKARQGGGGGNGETPEARKKRLRLLADQNQADTLKVIEDN